VRRNFVINSLGSHPQVAGEHLHIVVALKARDPQLASTRMRQYLQNGRAVLEERLRRGNASTDASIVKVTECNGRPAVDGVARSETGHNGKTGHNGLGFRWLRRIA
jgi:hypothetical protein